MRAVGVVRASVRAKRFSTDNFLWMGRVVCVSQFRLDRDKFDQRLGRLEKDGEAFDKAQNEFALGAQAATGAMASAPAPGGQNSAGIGELDQFYASCRRSRVGESTASASCGRRSPPSRA